MNLFLKGEIMSMAQLKYKRVLLKISGEALGGEKGMGLYFNAIIQTPPILSFAGQTRHFCYTLFYNKFATL